LCRRLLGKAVPAKERGGRREMRRSGIVVEYKLVRPIVATACYALSLSRRETSVGQARRHRTGRIECAGLGPLVVLLGLSSGQATDGPQGEDRQAQELPGGPATQRSLERMCQDFPLGKKSLGYSLY